MPASSIPHSFVLTDLFGVKSLELIVPDHVLEAEPGLEWVTCPTCEGEGWVEGSSSPWPNLPSAIPCRRCYRLGEVLDFPEDHRLEPMLRLAA